MKTIKRNKIRNDIANGRMQGKCHYDYSENGVLDSSKAEWVDCCLQGNRYVNGKLNIPEGYFTTKSGTAYWFDANLIILKVHDNLVYHLRYKK